MGMTSHHLGHILLVFIDWKQVTGSAYAQKEGIIQGYDSGGHLKSMSSTHTFMKFLIKSKDLVSNPVEIDNLLYFRE